MTLNSSTASPGTIRQSSTAPRAAYENRLREVTEDVRELSQRDSRFVQFRTAIFLGALALGILCIGESEHISWFWMLIPVVLFLSLLPFHQKCLRKLATAKAICRFHASRIQRLDRHFGTEIADGSEFADELHPWTQDLDVFGRGSLFQMLNECRTLPGRRHLASWMTQICEGETIRVRQARAQGLKQSLKLRESLACIPDSANWQTAELLLKNWVQDPSQPIPVWVLIWSSMIGLAAVPVISLVMLDMLSLKYLLMMIVLQTPAVIMTRRQIRHTAAQMDNVDSALRQFGNVIEVFEQHHVDEPAVRDLQNRFHSESETASRAIHRLSRLTEWQNNAMRNQFFAPIAWACGLFVLLTHLLECWRRQHGRDVPDWMETVACLEATVSVAGYSFDHPDDCLPEISDNEPILVAENLGHPLLKNEACVRNSVSLTMTTPLLLVSGSNMSGKSTFLRSIGSSVVLTFCGSVVRASRFRTYPFQLATAMRVSDSLQEGRSLFFSVVRRLKTVVDLTESPRIVLFLLDEILHGTNSHDRRRGAEAVIRSLVAHHALGIVTTHDLALTQIADTMASQAVNKHFEDTIVDGTMTFDYTLRDGVVERSNAIALMRMLGLDV
ncbi:MAG: hypothetical protein DWH78_11755 [Planctomycetota bacterium]|nr:MAG: hypothetical protein DWH78_11755 [Planctomycetota bacterium]